MQTKYRIKQVGNTYYPQKKVLFFWKYLKVLRCVKSNYSNLLNLYANLVILSANNLEEAIFKTNYYDNNYLRPFMCCGCRIQTYLDIDSGKYYYAVTDKLFSDSSEQLCEKISEYKRNQGESKKITIHKLYKNEEFPN